MLSVRYVPLTNLKDQLNEWFGKKWFLWRADYVKSHIFYILSCNQAKMIIWIKTLKKESLAIEFINCRKILSRWRNSTKNKFCFWENWKIFKVKDVSNLVKTLLIFVSKMQLRSNKCQKYLKKYPMNNIQVLLVGI